MFEILRPLKFFASRLSSSGEPETERTEVFELFKIQNLVLGEPKKNV